MRILCLLALWLSCGCSGSGPQIWMTEGIAAANDVNYGAALRDFTRGKETYEAFESRVFARATYFSPRFASAYARFRAERDGLPASEVQAAVEAAGKTAKAEARFFLAVVTNDPYWNDLDEADGTLKVRLWVSGGGPLRPRSIRRLSNDEMSDAVTFFPYAGPLTTGYWISFDPPADRRALRLKIAGPPAQLTLEWEAE